MSFPHTFVSSSPEGAGISTTLSSGAVGSTQPALVTETSPAATSGPNVEVAQSTSDAGSIGATQWRAVATRFGPNSSPVQITLPAGVSSTTATVNVSVMSIEVVAVD
jgi:hypothetical protein